MAEVSSLETYLTTLNHLNATSSPYHLRYPDNSISNKLSDSFRR